MVESALPEEDLRNALARAAVDNAERLWRAASSLLAAGSAPTGHSRCVLALEEVGKGDHLRPAGRH
jgi:AbiV family abortive infection protein